MPFNKISILIKSYISAMYLSRSIDCASKSKFDLAMDYYIKATNYCELPSEYILLEGFLLYKNLEVEKSYKLLCKFESDIQRCSDAYNVDEINYMVVYSKAIREVIGTVLKTYAIPNISYDNINLKRVRKHLKTNFPLVGHPDWAKGGVMQKVRDTHTKTK